MIINVSIFCVLSRDWLRTITSEYSQYHDKPFEVEDSDYLQYDVRCKDKSCLFHVRGEFNMDMRCWDVTAVLMCLFRYGYMLTFFCVSFVNTALAAGLICRQKDHSASMRPHLPALSLLWSIILTTEATLNFRTSATPSGATLGESCRLNSLQKSRKPLLH